jgi:hypothetical protein
VLGPVQDMRRCLSGLEMLSSLALPVTPQQSAAAGAPQLQIQDASERALVSAAGNGMHVACVAAACLVALVALSPRQ